VYDITPYLPGFTTNVVTTSVGSTPVFIARPNPRRPVLYISNPATNPLYIYIDPVPLLPVNPHIIIPAVTTWRFTWSEDAVLATVGWLGAYASGTATVIISEVVWTPENLGFGGQ
jgi:hypothetical protein